MKVEKKENNYGYTTVYNDKSQRNNHMTVQSDVMCLLTQHWLVCCTN